ncbi:sugar phosphate isomerase/epimerase family protein [candidate division KSB1 bacterium]
MKAAPAVAFAVILIGINLECSQDNTDILTEIGVCTSISNHKILEENGCSFIEESVGRFLVPNEPDDVFLENLEKLKESSLPVYACNGFIPGELKSVGPETDHEKILLYAETAFKRAQQCGIKTIVFGSGASRRIPEGFGKDQAEKQFIDLLKRMGSIAGKYGVVVSIEPLNMRETNFINTLNEGVEITKTVDHNNIRLLADLYHMLQENETPAEIINAGGLLFHCHIAEKDKRTPPGIVRDNFKPYFEALKQINYRGRISIECRWDDMKEQMPIAVEYLHEQIKDIYK